ncbi:hypothetical protein [Pseudobdellovibrio exovorus]|uniref:C-type lysozyme inhibitor domain-containing protein n=1 Tax=Pseudobdellovibrio exovorus JSS TaxID=1184267 RepID=M4VCY0_9BACT|nr:hypothetical protein [Pseudobdellovibrio exovorus]AGH95896.1 hypothetical protein A11Q_1680 [Pseudobdellovibrio exovorus JSS]
MKSIISFFAVVALSYSAHAFKDGSYNCRSEKSGYEVNYEIKSISFNGIVMPHLEVTQVHPANPEDPTSTEKVYVTKGLATQFLGQGGSEILGLGALRVEMKNGRPSCVK